MEEIQQSTSSSVLSSVPRMYSLTKLVEISYYNMARIRIEWSNIWAILGDHFNVVGCHANQHVAFFSVDSLRQLAVKFLEKDELSNFKFQKDFLRPFEHILSNNSSLVIKDMVLRCIHQMVQARAQNIRSGWKAVFSVLTKASRESNDGIVTMSFDLVKHIHNERFNHVMIVNHAFPDYVTCLVEFARNRGFPKINLQSVELIKASIPKILHVLKNAGKGGDAVVASTDNLAMPIPVSVKGPKDDPVLRYWFPIHFGFYEIVMTCELEVRARALKHLFDTLKEHGSEYTPEFWDVVSRGVIFPIFDDLRLTRSEKRQFENKDDMTVWLNTTLIQALRQLVDLFSHSFETLESTLMDGILDLIRVCFSVQQENETLAKIGSSCLQQLIENNATKMNESHWEKVTDTMVSLFDSTTAATLFEPDFVQEVMTKAEQVNTGGKHTRTTSSESASSIPAPTPGTAEEASSVNGEAPSPAAKRKYNRNLKKDFQQIILKCVLQLLVIQTTHDIINSISPVPIYQYMRSKHLLRILSCLDKSYTLAKDFNNDMPLRIALYKIGFMKQLPNLLKQETSSVLCLLAILYRMFADSVGAGTPTSSEPNFDLKLDRAEASDDIGKRLKAIAIDILEHFNSLEPSVKQRNIVTWTPVVVQILNGLLEMPDDKFQEHCPGIYRNVIEILFNHEPAADLRVAIHGILARVDELWKISTALTPAANSDDDDDNDDNGNDDNDEYQEAEQGPPTAASAGAAAVDDEEK